jgi:hypothetical protein
VRIGQKKFAEMLFDKISKFEERILTYYRREFAPRTFKRGVGHVHSPVNIIRVAVGDSGDELAGRRIDTIEGLAMDGVHPLSVDEELFGDAVEKSPRTILYRSIHFYASSCYDEKRSVSRSIRSSCTPVT